MSSSLTKDIIVARAGRNFRNGEQAFDLTTKDIDTIIENFKVLGKQVPLLLTPDHVFGGKKSAIPASGWVERMYRDGDAWHAQVKFVGDAADYVRNDQFRGVSIGTVMARDVHGKEVGEALDHLLITNAPFFSGLNIAARIAASTSPAVEIQYICSEPAVPEASRTAEEIQGDEDWGYAIAIAMNKTRGGW